MHKVQFHLDRLLFERNWKIPDLMKRSGVNKNTLYAIKKNEISRVDLKVLQSICDALQCALSDLMSYEPKGEHETKGLLFILSGPSGAGKNTLINSLRDRYDLGLTFIPSFATRPMRPGERNGNPYYFVSTEEFMAMADRGEFLEYESIHGNYYGTHLLTYERALDEGNIVIKDIDVNGALNMKKAFGDRVVLIYVRPTSLNDLEGRLYGRGDAEADIRIRMDRLKYEESLSDQFDYLIFNDDIPTATAELAQIIRTCTRKRA
ncbi:guanylate kinase [Alicyclobacillus sacchari]|uniref:Guanylate kinase n=1 Tax=Alicyclobacillus sacchari TaxID=392010 RepID=A0A4R8LLU3_9BACL|nr:guanylate kinase [Alicyclobacillus sacchari]TDY46267.1 guanylate kinase [Alicyclobacillus sacchari]